MNAQQPLPLHVPLFWLGSAHDYPPRPVWVNIYQGDGHRSRYVGAPAVSRTQADRYVRGEMGLLYRIKVTPKQGA